MIDSIKQTMIRNIRYIPYFFKRESSYSSSQYNYALFGKLSATILHDILTPINSLSLVSELEQKGQSKLHPIITESTKQIKEYVEIMRDFLEPTKNHTQTHVNIEIIKCIKLLTHKARLHSVSIQYIEFDQIYSKIDSMHIYQIVINLISNAIEASIQSESKKVILILKKEKDTFIFECKDFGSGISKDILSKISTPHFTTKETGTGLGLFSVKHILSQYLNGSLFIQSEPNQGSLFSCHIPLVK